MEANKDRIREFIGKHVRGHEIGDDEDIFASGFVNSMFAMQLVQFVEQQFGVVVNDEDLEIANFQSVNAIAALVERKTAAPAA
ncbi:MAG: acyl carrier protein [Gemmatimonadetes bacterium]|nr:acyl carrier protein [Gemmatimonadota bacterium]